MPGGTITYGGGMFTNLTGGLAVNTVWHTWLNGTATTTATLTLNIDDNVWRQWNEAIAQTTVTFTNLARAISPKTREEVLLLDSFTHPGPRGTLFAEWTALLTAEDIREFEDRVQRAAEEERERIHQAEVARLARQAEVEAADRKAEQLLTSLLSAEQKREWLESRWITEVAASGRVYRLYPLWSGGVSIQSEADREVRRITLCIHPRERVPNCDAMVSNLLLIRADEDRLIKLAVNHGGDWSAEERAIRVRPLEELMPVVAYGEEEPVAWIANREGVA